MTDQRKSIRPLIPSISISEQTSLAEQFQNETLRPIIKLQHDLLIAIFKDYFKKSKQPFSDLAKEQQAVFVNQVFQKDIAFRNELCGVIIGQFTVEEYRQYAQSKSSYNKRLKDIIQQRIISNLELFAWLSILFEN